VSVEPVRRRARAGLGRTFQDVRLFESLTVLENVAVYAQSGSTQSLAGALARPIRLRKQDRVAKERARTALAYVDAERLADRVASSLSYAEQKIVSIARLLAMDSRVLLLDEPASGVDEQGRERLLSILEKVSGEDGRTVCLVEHNLDVVRRLADSVVFIAEGAVVAAGDPTTIFESRELAELYLGDRRGR
jgi:ABC-type branched-subunit amino acid transport system ATPase component